MKLTDTMYPSILHVIILACTGRVILSEEFDTQGRSREVYPDPMLDHIACNRPPKSYICDPDNLISKFEAQQLNAQIESIVNETTCPCSRHSCSRHPGGYKIGIALTKRIQPDEPMPEEEYLTEEEYRAKQKAWTLEEAKKFTHVLLSRWKLSRCEESVIIFYSLYDSVLYAAAGTVAREKLDHARINSVLNGARAQFEANGNLFKGLLKISKDFRSVFIGTYQPGKTSASESRARGSAEAFTKGDDGVKRLVFGCSLVSAIVLYYVGRLL